MSQDNGPQLKSDEFESFLKANGIVDLTTAPFYPATNGQAERFVQTMKKALMATRGEGESLQLKLSRFLLAYRNAPHATLNESPAMLFVKRHLRSRLDLIQSKMNEVNKQKILKQIADDKGRLPKTLVVNQKVATLDHRLNDNKWVVGTIASVLGPLTYNVRIHPNVIWKRHINQIIPLSQKEGDDCAVTPYRDYGYDGDPLSDRLSRDELREQNNREIADSNFQQDQMRRYPLRENRRPPDRYNVCNYW